MRTENWELKSSCSLRQCVLHRAQSTAILSLCNWSNGCWSSPPDQTTTWKFALETQLGYYLQNCTGRTFQQHEESRRRLPCLLSCQPHYQPYHHCRLSSKISTTRNQISIFGLKIWTSLKTNYTLHCKKPRSPGANKIIYQMSWSVEINIWFSWDYQPVCNITVTKH